MCMCDHQGALPGVEEAEHVACKGEHISSSIPSQGHHVAARKPSHPRIACSILVC